MSWLYNFSPIRYFPDYPGPYPVGTCDVELPAHELDSPSPSPDESIGTVSFRVFYPCKPTASKRPVRWVPSPQSKYVSAYARFLGANPTLSDFLSIFPQFLYLTQIPVLRNAELLEPTTADGRWPVVVFSHGLGGSRNAYSHLCGSLASHGMVVMAVDHRDTSAPVSFVRATEKTAAKTVWYQKMPHTPSPEVYKVRDQQLRVRMWELGLLHDAIVKIDLGTAPSNLDPNMVARGKRMEMMPMFKGKLDLHRPGSIIWTGHSFGAATTTQFIKHTYYGPPPSEKVEDEALFEPRRSSGLVKQITSRSVAVLLDMWCLPLRSKKMRWLWDKPMPCYDVTKDCAGGSALLTVLSEAFRGWEGNMNDTKRTLLPKEPAPSSDMQWKPHAFYPESAAHLSQSDFNILFPWLTARVLKTKDPERLLKLNVRAIVQLIRSNGYEVAPVHKCDIGGPDPALEEEHSELTSKSEEDLGSDPRILDPQGHVRGWLPIAMETVAEEGMHTEEDYHEPTLDMDEAQVKALDIGSDKAQVTA